MRCTSLILAALLALSLLTACGQKGPLKLPPDSGAPAKPATQSQSGGAQR